ncbi:MAG: outer membrane protein assembly factor BamA [Phycisphaerae bacterium]|nr:outer membrane protein assembly factor BamA [Phycisphaerae bacterium]
MRLMAGWMLTALCLTSGICTAQSATAAEAEGLSIGRVEAAGNVTLTRSEILAATSLRPGQRFSAVEASADVQRIASLGPVETAYYTTGIADGRVTLTYEVVEKNLVRTLVLRGNKGIGDSRLLNELTFTQGDYLDAFAVRTGRDAIEAFYHKRGYAWATVTLNEAAMLVGQVEYIIEEGPRPKIKKVRFSGNQSFTDSELKKAVNTKPRKLLIFQEYYNIERVDEDEQKLIDVYQKRAFLDVKVSSEVVFDDDKKTAEVIFHIEEGPVYLVDSIRFTGHTFFDQAQLRQDLRLREDFYYSHDRAEFDARKIRGRYLELGFVEAQVELKRVFLPGARVAVEFVVTEGPRFRIGEVMITGNTSLKDHSIRRVLDEEGFEPGAWYDADDASGIGNGELEQIVQHTIVAESVVITPTGDAPDTRDAMVNIREGQTGSIMFGAGVASDAGIIGSITLDQRNFDITDWPESFGDLFTGKAFRGAGQRMRIALNPGTVYSTYSINFTEPYLYDQPVSLNVGGASFSRYRESWDEGRLTGSLSLERRYRDDWRRGIAFRGEQVRISNLDADVPKEIFDVKGDNILYGTRFYVRRDRTDSSYLPTQGYNFDAGYEQIFGDFTFGILSGTQRWYKTLYEDLAENKTVLETKIHAGTVIGTAPMFEKFHAGGLGSIRGFRYRGVSPRKGPDDDPIGSDWLIMGSAEVAIPLGSQTFAWLFFGDVGMIDSGPIRMSLGTGIQVMIPQFFGPVPMRFELASPLTKDDKDETQAFSFSVGALF